MATTSFRALTLLSLLAARRDWACAELAARLGVSTRTVRRDINTLRELGYPVEVAKGPDGGYRLGAGSTLPPLLFDDDQAVAVALALQTTPLTVFGLREASARALDTLRQVMPARLRAEIDSMQLTSLPNYWEFTAPPIGPATLKAVGDAVRRRHLLRFDHLRADGTRPDPRDADFAPPRTVEPHHLVVWAGRWYLVARDPLDDSWPIFRIDRIHPRTPTGVPFNPRTLPNRSVAEHVVTSYDRSDTPAEWPCLGSAVLHHPAALVARWAPGGSVVEPITPTTTRLTLGAWSWAGIAGILATFDTELTDIQPADLHTACTTLARRYQRATQPEIDD
ncbi:helix-turn-helix transcriptional regulator [Amycolatopsis taiwanensis]|uniref:helix-turn-helix transcriptional regulator n=1 Tax=Amycolatopsis taiwanensis TaxID=342230 RepID=UPI0004876072|nr:WYL domain-containing protein [Amycolatopsis taiwanensis]